ASRSPDLQAGAQEDALSESETVRGTVSGEFASDPDWRPGQGYPPSAGAAIGAAPRTPGWTVQETIASHNTLLHRARNHHRSQHAAARRKKPSPVTSQSRTWQEATTNPP